MSSIASLSAASDPRQAGQADTAARSGGSYSVERGDTLSAIARRNGTDVQSLLALNPQVRNPDVLYPGDALALPARDSVSVRSGDTLSGIATANGTTVQALLAANPGIRNPDLIHVGQTIVLPGSTGATPPATPPSPVDPAPDVDAAPPVRGDGDHVPGGLSEQYETGGRGPGTVSTGNGDLGGVSYGSYQLATNMGRPQEFLANEGSRWAAEFGDAAPGTAAFSDAWRGIAAREPEAFAEAQHDFIQRTHYDVQVAHVEGSAGVDLSTRSPAVQDVVWSTAVQHGPNSNVITRAIANVEAGGLTPDDGVAYDRALIDAVYDERGRRNADGNLVYFSGSSANVQAGVAQRFVDERADAHAMLDGR
ncbi:LysM peptidoglycan-binding domain-containing protein [Luteimonas sp. BDR2-5]|uniref:LysM peptidoglycan-binding domain-containing protein n=1 Tax=Proluteimonas luteida TaxID=2878685 RepID=UPI001E2E2BAD|nr:LysM peptidoglycan-binding domain-containing protein [Luteimonas sp. BDR2-5]MCD9027774.1 LysM peptidoglycan-binding domain-containing protein [Luteimonas sp. BDR2-5]